MSQTLADDFAISSDCDPPGVVGVVGYPGKVFRQVVSDIRGSPPSFNQQRTLTIHIYIFDNIYQNKVGIKFQNSGYF